MTIPDKPTSRLQIYAEGELAESATCKEFLQVQKEGSHLVKQRKFYTPKGNE